ncbi:MULTISPECIES: hypothetical protein [unclassified Mesorhizobium]|uniref:hypothetical protein n=1 Tax=unclassified Mesorhizobium TaxID=325217 RepID=UPI0012DE8B6B|nr:MULTISPECIES: hypothetical protein [unclassified Mesorhizobium]WJI43614.1 hypothetical protein NL532_23680 [Mesorhizobium sp. C120A]
MADGPANPFQRSMDRYTNFRLEYQDFLEKYEAIYQAMVQENTRFQSLKHWTAAFHKKFYIENSNGEPIRNAPPPTLQFQFGNRPLGLGRLNHEGKTASESGSVLVYSFGATGAVAVMLYPAKGDLSSTEESSILLRIGYYTSFELQNTLRRDLLDWVSYAYVSGIDGDPTFCERFRVSWLRLAQPKYHEGKPQPAVLPGRVREIFSVTIRLLIGSALGAGFKVVVPTIVGFLIGLFFS